MEHPPYVTPEDAFEICLQALQTGATLEVCLQLYPQWAEAFRPALEAAQAAIASPVAPSVQAMQHSRTRLLGQAAALRGQRQLSSQAWGGGRWLRLAFASLLTLMLILGSGGLMAVSAQALPGDQMYPIKRAVEQVRLQIAPSLEQKTAIETTYQQRRVDEILQLFRLRRVARVSFQGVVQEQHGEYWRVAGVLVAVHGATQQIGTIEVGMVVELEGSTHSGGWVTADEVHLKARELVGVVQQMERSFWVVADTRLMLTPLSQLDPRLQVGDLALVMLQAEHDGSLSARAILRYPLPVVVTATPEATFAIPVVVTPTPVVTVAPPVATTLPSQQIKVEFQGQVTHIAGNLWTIGVQQVVVSAETRFEGAPQVGDWVAVEAWFAPNGSLFALEIEKKSGQEREQEQHEDDAAFGGHEQPQAPDPSPREQDEHEDGEYHGGQQSPGDGHSSSDEDDSGDDSD